MMFEGVARGVDRGQMGDRRRNSPVHQAQRTLRGAAQGYPRREQGEAYGQAWWKRPRLPGEPPAAYYSTSSFSKYSKSHIRIKSYWGISKDSKMVRISEILDI